MPCARCASETLEATYLGPVSVFRCSTCEGHWFGQGELIACLRSPAIPYLADRWQAAQVPVVRVTGPARCPVCDIDLTRRRPVELGKAAVDLCSRCGGTWLDGQEIRQAFHARTLGRPIWVQWWDAIEQVVAFWRRS